MTTLAQRAKSVASRFSHYLPQLYRFVRLSVVAVVVQVVGLPSHPTVRTILLAAAVGVSEVVWRLVAPTVSASEATRFINDINSLFARVTGAKPPAQLTSVEKVVEQGKPTGYVNGQPYWGPKP